MSWQCKHCEQFSSAYSQHTDIQIVGDYNSSFATKDGNTAFISNWKLCPNPKCKGVTYSVSKYNCKNHLVEHNGHLASTGVNKPELDFLKMLTPISGNYKEQPDCIPLQIRQDYYEAGRILNLSPKASATLLRRCLQGMIRDFWGIKKATLKLEIDELEKQHPGTKDLIDPIRSIGNIGAHMEKDVNLIIEIEPSEASLLKEMIEQLFDDWYIDRQKRLDRVEKLKGIVSHKEGQKMLSTSEAAE